MLLLLAGLFCPVIVIGVVYYMSKRLRHKQIMAAVEKGTVLSELMPARQRSPLWIRSICLGVAMLVIAFGLVMPSQPGTIIAFVLAGAGAAWIVRGLLLRKDHLQPKVAV
jgi:Na+/H+ antiporter NhaD/arsenite permease-like protein